MEVTLEGRVETSLRIFFFSPTLYSKMRRKGEPTNFAILPGPYPVLRSFFPFSVILPGLGIIIQPIK